MSASEPNEEGKSPSFLAAPQAFPTSISVITRPKSSSSKSRSHSSSSATSHTSMPSTSIGTAPTSSKSTNSISTPVEIAEPSTHSTNSTRRPKSKGTMNGFLGDYGRSASTPNMMLSGRPSSALSTGSGISAGTSTTQNTFAMKMERDLLERMVQERDEKVKSLQKTIDMQKDYIDNLQLNNDKVQEKMKREAARQKLHLQSVTHEKNLVKGQLKVLQRENLRIKNDPIHLALTRTNVEGGNSNQYLKNKHPSPSSPPILTKEEEDSIDGMNDDNDELVQSPPTSPEIKILDNDQRCLILQSQLYQAMNSLSTLQKQTSVLKENYDEILISLQKELMEAEESKTKMEVKLLSRMTVLEREKAIVEELLQEKIDAKDSRLKRLEKRIQHLDAIDDDESIDQGDDSVGLSSSSNKNDDESKEDNKKGGNEMNDIDTINEEGEEDDDDDDDDDAQSNADSTGAHAGGSGSADADAAKSKREGLLSELKMLSENSSSRRLFSNLE